MLNTSSYLIVLIIVLTITVSSLSQGNVGVSSRLVATVARSTGIQADTFDLSTGGLNTVVNNIKVPILSGEQATVQNKCNYDKLLGQTADLLLVNKVNYYIFYFDTRVNTGTPTRKSIKLPPKSDNTIYNYAPYDSNNLNKIIYWTRVCKNDTYLNQACTAPDGQNYMRPQMLRFEPSTGTLQSNDYWSLSSHTMYNLKLMSKSHWMFNGQLYFVQVAVGGNAAKFKKLPDDTHRVLILYGFNGAGLSFINLGYLQISSVAVSSDRVFFVTTFYSSGVLTYRVEQIEAATGQSPAYPAVTKVKPKLVIHLTSHTSPSQLVYDSKYHSLELNARRKDNGDGVILVISLNPLDFTGTVTKELAYDTAAARLTYGCMYRTL